MCRISWVNVVTSASDRNIQRYNKYYSGMNGNAEYTTNASRLAKESQDLSATSPYRAFKSHKL